MTRSTKAFPAVETISYDPEDISNQQAFLRSARRFLSALMSQIGDVVDVCRRYFKAYGGLSRLRVLGSGGPGLVVQRLCSKFCQICLDFRLCYLGRGGSGPSGRSASEKRGDGAPLVDAVASTFVHFIVVQGIALIMAVLGSSGIGAMMTSLLSSVSAGSFLTWSVYIVAKASTARLLRLCLFVDARHSCCIWPVQNPRVGGACL